MITHCWFSPLFYWANGLTPVQHHNASLLTMIKILGCHLCNTVPGCEVFLFMLANDAHVRAISLITTSVKTLVGPSPLHCPSHSTTPGEWVFVGWRLDCTRDWDHMEPTTYWLPPGTTPSNDWPIRLKHLWDQWKPSTRTVAEDQDIIMPKYSHRPCVIIKCSPYNALTSILTILCPMEHELDLTDCQIRSRDPSSETMVQLCLVI